MEESFNITKPISPHEVIEPLALVVLLLGNVVVIKYYIWLV